MVALAPVTTLGAASVPRPPLANAEWDLLILDLDGDGLFLSDRFYPVTFDLGRGPERTAWTAGGRNEAFLWLDSNGNGQIDGAAELIGTGFVHPALPTPPLTGFEVLAMFDQSAQGGNGDHRLNHADEVWDKLELWVDRDHDGELGERESAGLGSWGLIEIQIGHQRAREIDGSLNRHRFVGRFVRDDGSRRGVRKFLDGTITAVAFDRLADAPSGDPTLREK